MAKLSARQKREICARYMAGEKVSDLARSFGVSHTAIAKLLKSKNVAESLKNAEIETFATMAAFVEAKRGQIQSILEEIFESLSDKIEKASFRDCVASIKELTALYIKDKEAEEKKEASAPVIQFVFEDTGIKKDDKE